MAKEKKAELPKQTAEDKNANVAILITCKPSDREVAAEEEFLERMDATGGVMAINPSCGGSVYFKTLEEFPKNSCRCTCGQPGHFIVKYVSAK